ncbi:NACHT and WD repeat domain-containing [Apis cerana cerana]|uniref:NACHT and WD repeat domain-containing n=1 Tax=Apis cerana cerana TaxID=94128 RepID=A0A2A3E2Y2_APICC|nr:NACHT and WD repeat domain-containing [Apis cerana cerana]
MEKLRLNESYSNEEETCYKIYTNFDSSDEEEMRFFKKRNINNIISSDSDSDIDKCNSDSEYNEDINEILRELVIEEEKKVDDTESAIQFNSFIRQLPDDINPHDIFSLFVDDDIINLLALETIDAKIKLTNPDEIKKFLGLILWIGFVKANPIANY